VKRTSLIGITLVAVALGACGRQASDVDGTGRATVGGTEPLSTRNMPAVAGQRKTCTGGRDKTFNLDVIETDGVDLGMGTRFAAWTYNGRVPGPTLEACEGDLITINVHNKGTTSHGLDSHALKIDARKYGPTPPGTTLTITKSVETPGVYMYHCAAGPVTDIHIKSGIHGAMIVYPRHETLRPARELVVVEDAVFGARDANGLIPGTDPARTLKNDQLFSMFNGRLDNEAVRVNPRDLVRIYFVNVGPWTAAAHVIGSVFDRVSDGRDWSYNVQTHGVPAGAGAMLEFYIPEPGVFPFVDHDKLAFLPYGLSLSFATAGLARTAH
jgi:nitrite reductase (NO-forming)